MFKLLQRVSQPYKQLNLNNQFFQKFATVQPRNPNFNKISQNHINYFQDILGQNSVLTEDLQKYNDDWLGKYKGQTELVLFPRSAEDVSKILKYCNKELLAVVPQSGNTGLVGGSIPVYDEIIISLEKMNNILSYNKQTDVLNVEGGVVLEQANNYLQSLNSEIPWDLGAKGSCCIAGNVSTQAGGKYFVKYGSLRGYILGVEVVTGEGEILNLQSQIRKDNTGIDIKQLFIGSEGALGIITKINVLCSKIDKLKNLIYVRCSSYQDVLNIYSIAKKTLNRNLAAIEWMDSQSFQLVTEQLPHISNPFDDECEIDKDFYVLVEINTNHEMEVLETELFENLMELDGFKDCIKAQSEQQYTDLWEIRESVAEACTKGAKAQLKYDISLDIGQMNELLVEMRQKLEGLNCLTVGYGHIGDSNLHINVLMYDLDKQKQVEETLEPFIYEYVSKKTGSISAEHGIGIMKTQYLPLQKQEQSISYMRQIKKVFDPNGILNPYKMFPKE